MICMHSEVHDPQSVFRTFCSGGKASAEILILKHFRNSKRAPKAIEMSSALLLHRSCEPLRCLAESMKALLTHRGQHVIRL